MDSSGILSQGSEMGSSPNGCRALAGRDPGGSGRCWRSCAAVSRNWGVLSYGCPYDKSPSIRGRVSLWK